MKQLPQSQRPVWGRAGLVRAGASSAFSGGVPCALRGTSRWIERAALLQAGTVGPAASDLKRQAGLTVSGGRHLGQSPPGSSFWPKPGKGRAPARLSSPGQRPSCGCSYGPRFQAEGSAQAAHMVRLTSWPGPPAQEHGATPDTLPPSLATPTPVPTPGLCPGRCSARSVLPPPSHRSPPTCPRSGSRGDACPRDAQITAAACIPGTLPTAGRGRCAL